MTDSQKIDLILAEMKGMNKRMDNLESKVSSLDSKVSSLDSKVSSLDSRISNLEASVSELKETVNKNYDKTLEFYGCYKEESTAFSEKLDLIGGILEMHNTQIARNTAMLKKIS